MIERMKIYDIFLVVILHEEVVCCEWSDDFNDGVWNTTRKWLLCSPPVIPQ